jgi:hypothetical protein
VKTRKRNIYISRSKGYTRIACGLITVMVFWLLILVLHGCSRHDPNKYIFASEDSVKMDRLFTLSIQGDSVLSADGFSIVSLEAIVRDVTEGPRKIQFTTTSGVLRSGGVSYGDTATIDTDLQGRASIDIVSPREACLAKVNASILGVKPVIMQETTIRFTTAVVDSIIAFIESPDSAMANSSCVSTFSVRISPNLTGEDRKVAFATTQGQFIPVTGNGQTKIVRADENNMASVTLSSPDTVTAALVTANVKGYTAEETIRFVAVPADSVLRFTEAPDTAPADGASTSRFVVSVSPNFTGLQNPSVTFETTQGTFVTSGASSKKIVLTVDGNRNATAFLTSLNQTGTALVTASVKNFVQSHTIIFEKALPDTILIELKSLQIKADAQMQIVAQLYRNGGAGIATVGTEVTFQAADSLGKHLDGARFFNTTRSDDKGTASAYFTPDNISYRGYITIIVSLKSDSAVEGRAQLKITD